CRSSLHVPCRGENTRSKCPFKFDHNTPTTTRYLSAMSVAKGVVTLTGQESLNGLGVTLTPTWDNAEGVTGWQRVCTITGNSALQQACEDVFRVK
ncbi:hypothetical protein AAGO70_10190, partial [Klebsiella pneumoniae]